MSNGKNTKKDVALSAEEVSSQSQFKGRSGLDDPCGHRRRQSVFDRVRIVTANRRR